jgi:hypothetical protein
LRTVASFPVRVPSITNRCHSSSFIARAMPRTVPPTYRSPRPRRSSGCRSRRRGPRPETRARTRSLPVDASPNGAVRPPRAPVHRRWPDAGRGVRRERRAGLQHLAHPRLRRLRGRQLRRPPGRAGRAAGRRDQHGPGEWVWSPQNELIGRELDVGARELARHPRPDG